MMEHAPSRINLSISCSPQQIIINNYNHRLDDKPVEEENLRGEHVCKQIATHGSISKSAVTSARFTVPNLRTVTKRPLKSLKTQKFRLVSGRVLEAKGGYCSSPEESSESSPPSSSEEEEEEEEANKMDKRNLPLIRPQLNDAQKHQELMHLKGLLEFRINKQQLLLDKIEVGKWKSSQTSERILYALAKNDLKLLMEQDVNVESQIANLKKTTD